MTSKKDIKKQIKAIIKEECCIYKVKASDDLDLDLKLEKSDYKDLRDALNDKYNLELQKRDLKKCDDVNDIIDLVYDLIEGDLDKEEIQIKDSSLTIGDLYEEWQRDTLKGGAEIFLGAATGNAIKIGQGGFNMVKGLVKGVKDSIENPDPNYEYQDWKHGAWD